MSDFHSVGDLLRGDGSNGGYWWRTRSGTTITIGPAKDATAPGGEYISINTPFGEKTSILYDREGNILAKK